MIRKHALALALSVFAAIPAMADIAVHTGFRNFLFHIDGQSAVAITIDGRALPADWGPQRISFTPETIRHHSACNPVQFRVVGDTSEKLFTESITPTILCDEVSAEDAVVQDILARSDLLIVNWPKRQVIFSRGGADFITFKLEN